MKNQTNSIIAIAALSMVFLIGCKSTQQSLTRGCNDIYVSDQWISSVIQAASIKNSSNMDDVDKQIKALEVLVNSKQCQKDPVVMNLLAVAYIRNGQVDNGFELLSHALSLIEQNRLLQSNSTQKFEYNHEPISTVGYNGSNENEIIALFRDGFKDGNLKRVEFQLIDKIQKRPHIPYPPFWVNNGIVGLILEAVNEVSNGSTQAKVVWYADPNQDFNSQIHANRDILKANMVLAAMVDMDDSLLESLLEDLVQSNSTQPEVRAVVALGLFIRGDSRYRRFFSMTDRQLYR